MGSYRMIVYPFGLAVSSLLIVALFAMAIYGVQSTDWEEWQLELVGTVGSFVGLGAAVIGLWLAIRSEERAAR